MRRTPDRPLVALIGGLTELRKNSDLAIVVGCCVVQLLVRGFLTVLLVSVSFDLLGLGSSGVGWLAAMLGIGGIVGGLGAVVLTGRRRLGRPFALALCLWGLPIVLIGVHPTTAIVVVALFTIGVGNALLDVSGLTLIQRLGSDRSLGRVFGVLFTVGIAIGGVGALAAPVLVSALGLRVVLVVVGAILPMLALVLMPRLRSLDDRSEPVPELLELFCDIPLFAPLPPTSIEKVAARCTTSELPAGSVIITEGDRGDHFYAILRGQVEVLRAGFVESDAGSRRPLRRDRVGARHQPHRVRRRPDRREGGDARLDGVPRRVDEQRGRVRDCVDDDSRDAGRSRAGQRLTDTRRLFRRRGGRARPCRSTGGAASTSPVPRSGGSAHG